MAGKDPSHHGQNVRTVVLKLFTIMRDHGKYVLIVPARQQGVPGNDGWLIALMDNH